MSETDDGLKALAFRQTLWVAGGTYLKTGVNFLANVVLMRIIAPDQFGALAMGLFFLTLGRKLLGFGFNHALVHRQNDLDRAAAAHWWLHMVCALVVTAAAFVAEPFVAARYDAATARALVWLAVFGILDTAGNTPRILLEKELRFEPLVRLDLFNTVVSNALGIAAGLAGLGWAALVGKQALAWIVQTAGVWRLWGPLKTWKPDVETSAWFLRFGTPLLWAGLATFISLQFDDFLVGHFDGNESLGFYAKAYTLATFPTALVTHIVGRVAFPVYARLQNDRDALSTAFNAVVRTIITLTSPAVLLLGLLAADLVPPVFGEAWRPMTSILHMLILYAFLRPVFDNCGELFTAVGRPEVGSRILLAQAAAVLIGAPPLTWLYGAHGAAAAVGVALLVGVVRAYQHVPRYVNFSALKSFGPAVGAGLAGIAVATALPLDEAGPAVRVAVKTTVFIAVYALVMAAVEGRRWLDDIRRWRAMRRPGGAG